MLKLTCEDQEKALAELGSHLSELVKLYYYLFIFERQKLIHNLTKRSKLRVEDLREAQAVMKDASWADDKEASACKACNKQFSVSRRKVY